MNKNCRKCGANVLGEGDLCSFCARAAGAGSGTAALPKCTRCGNPLKPNQQGPMCGNCAYMAESAAGPLCVKCSAPAVKGTFYCHLCAPAPLQRKNPVSIFSGMSGILVFMLVALGAAVMGYMALQTGFKEANTVYQYVGYVMIGLSVVTLLQVVRSFRSM